MISMSYRLGSSTPPSCRSGIDARSCDSIAVSDELNMVVCFFTCLDACRTRILYVNCGVNNTMSASRNGSLQCIHDLELFVKPYLLGVNYVRSPHSADPPLPSPEQKDNIDNAVVNNDRRTPCLHDLETDGTEKSIFHSTITN